jgi:hypothetical protein
MRTKPFYRFLVVLLVYVFIGLLVGVILYLTVNMTAYWKGIYWGSLGLMFLLTWGIVEITFRYGKKDVKK